MKLSIKTKKISTSISRLSLAIVLFSALFIACSVTLHRIGFANAKQGVMNIIWTVSVFIFLGAIIKRYIQLAWAKRVFWAGAMVRYLVGLFNYRFGFRFFGATDFQGYFWPFSKQIYDGQEPTHYWVYLDVLNVEYHIFGYNLYLLVLMSFFICALGGFLILKLGIEVAAPKQAIQAITIFGFISPFIMAFQCVPLREGWYFFAGAAMMYATYKWLNGEGYGFLFLGLAATLFADLVCEYKLSGWFIGYVCLAILFKIKKHRFRINNRNNRVILVALAGAAFVAAVLMFSHKYGAVLLNYVNSWGETVMSNQTGLNDNPSTYLYYMRMPTMFHLIAYTPLRFFYYMFSPLPWNWRNIKDVLAFFIDSVYHMVVIILTVKYLWNKNGSDKDRAMVWFGLAAAFSTALIYTWGTQNAGTAIRHRNVVASIELMMLLIISKKNERAN